MKWLLSKGLVQGCPEGLIDGHRAEQKKGILQKNAWEGCANTPGTSSLLTRRLKANTSKTM